MSLITAFGLFTVVPMPPVTDLNRRVAGRAIAALPWVGLIVGLAAGAVLWGATAAGAAPLLGASLALALLAAVTGALHLDGLADTADGLGSRKPADEALAIMRRSDIGPMGVVTLLFALVIGVAALSSLGEADPVVAAAAVAVAAMVGRTAIVVATVSPRAARAEGFGALFTGVSAAWSAALNVAAGVVVAGALGWLAGGWDGALRNASALALALAVGALWTRHLRRRLGGLTGDTFGSIAEVTQLIFLVATALL